MSYNCLGLRKRFFPDLPHRPCGPGRAENTQYYEYERKQFPSPTVCPGSSDPQEKKIKLYICIRN